MTGNLHGGANYWRLLTVSVLSLKVPLSMEQKFDLVNLSRFLTFRSPAERWTR
jgi:hypothetical protein